MSMLRQQGSVQVLGLAALFDVSTQTIRQDLKFLVKIGVAMRAYGGAMLRDQQSPALETGLELKRQLFLERKASIGACAAALIKSGDSVILDSGTTTLQIAAHIAEDIQATVITNDLAIAHELAARDNVQLLMLGGALRRKNMSLYGTQAEQVMQSLSVDKLFLGVDGFDIQKGITTHFEAEAILNRKMCAAATEIIVVSDSSKCGRVCLHRILDVADVARLITDAHIPEAMRAALVQLGVEVTCVED